MKKNHNQNKKLKPKIQEKLNKNNQSKNKLKQLFNK